MAKWSILPVFEASVPTLCATGSRLAKSKILSVRTCQRICLLSKLSPAGSQTRLVILKILKPPQVCLSDYHQFHCLKIDRDSGNAQASGEKFQGDWRWLGFADSRSWGTLYAGAGHSMEHVSYFRQYMVQHRHIS